MSQFYWKPVLWTRAYCLLTAGGAHLDIIKHYIQTQDPAPYLKVSLSIPTQILDRRLNNLGGKFRDFC